MIDSFLYLPDYPIGHLIAFQIEEQMEKAGNVGAGVRADGEVGQHHAGPVDEERDGLAGGAGGAPRRNGEGSNSDSVARPGAGSPSLSSRGK